MPRSEHAKALDALSGRHKEALKSLTVPVTMDWELWLHRWLTTPQQLKFLEGLVEQVETSQIAARKAASNLEVGLRTIIEANNEQ